MSIDIDPLTLDQLMALNHRIVERIKFLEQAQAHVQMMQFNLGAAVSFDSQYGRQFGTLIKFNRKTVTVDTEDGRRWRISPHLLSPIKETADPELSEKINIPDR